MKKIFKVRSINLCFEKVIRHTNKFFLCIFFAQATLVNAATPVVPSIDSILKNLKQSNPGTINKEIPDLVIENQASTKSKLSTQSFFVKRIAITKNSLFGTDVLSSLIADGNEKMLTLVQLNELADRITAYYQNHGYPLARAEIPAQNIENGVVIFEILEPRYGQIILNNSSSVRDSLLRTTLQALKSNDVIEQIHLDHVLLMLSDFPSVKINAKLMAGVVRGTSDLQVDVTPTAPILLSLTADTNGNPNTGQSQVGSNLSIHNPLQIGDRVDISVITSGSGFKYAQLDYELPVGGSGLHSGLGVSNLECSIGTSLAAAKVHGFAEDSSLWIRGSLIRSMQTNVSWKLKYDQLILKDHVDSGQTSVRTDRQISMITGNMNGDVKDAVGQSSVLNWRTGISSGSISFNDADAQVHDAATTQTLGQFSKWNTSFNIQKGLNEKSDLNANLYFQLASKNLDASQKISIGGPHAVRAYGSDIPSGDSGYLASIEYKYQLGSLLAVNYFGVAFVDFAGITVNERPWPLATGDNFLDIQGVGFGLIFKNSNQWQATTYFASPIGNASVLSGMKKSDRVWFDFVRRF
jgi:hemolysin activation/secretion protein